MKDFLLLINQSKKLTNYYWSKILQNAIFLFPLVFFFFLLNLLTLHYELDKQTKSQQVLPTPLVQAIAPYPIFKSVLGESSLEENSELIPLSSEAAIVLDDTSKVVLFSKNSKLRFSTASTAKIMTALTALDFYKMDDILTIKTEKVEGVVVGFEIGEKVKFIDLLYAMLLPSGNDAALAIAQNYEGGQEAFVEKMNQKTAEYHLVDTHFSDAVGLLDQGDYSSAFDLANLSSILMHNSTLSEIVGTKQKIITTLNGNEYKLSNLNKLLGSYGVEGIKTGFTYEAEGVLATSTAQNGHRIIIVVMKSKDRFFDTTLLLKMIEDNLSYKEFKEAL